MTFKEFRDFRENYLLKFDSYDELLDFFNNEDHQHFDSLNDLVDYIDGYFVTFDIGYCSVVYLRTDGKKFTKELVGSIVYHEIMSVGHDIVLG